MRLNGKSRFSYRTCEIGVLYRQPALLITAAAIGGLRGKHQRNPLVQMDEFTILSYEKNLQEILNLLQRGYHEKKLF
jgi:hypothetical protein